MISKSVTMTASHVTQDRTIDSVIAALHELRNEIPGGEATVEVAPSSRSAPPGGYAVIACFYITATWTKELKA